MTERSILNRDIVIAGLGIALIYYYCPQTVVLIIGGIYLLLCSVIHKVKVINHHFWSTLTQLMQSVTSPILFGAIFMVILVPIGVLYRVFGKKKDHQNSTFETVDRRIDRVFFDVPW